MAEAVATSSHETASDAPVPGTTHSKNVPWYTEELPKIPEETRKLLEEYSHIPPDEVEKHVIDIVRFTFLNLVTCACLSLPFSSLCSTIYDLSFSFLHQIHQTGL